ncbi:acyl carrier protein [Caenispirillum salinarum]|uniref:acyl carrier protein n=1 Tax=Caenispirillum salinarum TaxID=859058 RepID=UPI00384DAAE4
MTTTAATDLRAAVIDELRALTPETDPTDIPEDADIREALDFDSMDVLNFVTGLSKRTGVDIPERDVPEVLTIAGAVAYLTEERG